MWGEALPLAGTRKGRLVTPRGTDPPKTGSHTRENQTNISKTVLRKKRRRCREDPARGTKELEQQRPGLGSVQAFSASSLALRVVRQVRCCPHLPTPSHSSQTGGHILCCLLGQHLTPPACALLPAWGRLCNLFIQAVKTQSNFRVSM